MVPAPDPADSDPPDGAGERSSPTFSRHVSRVTDRFDDLVPFALVPVALSLFEFESVRRALDPSARGFSINVEFAFPTPLFHLWSLVDPPEPSGPPDIGPGTGPPIGGPSGTTASSGLDVTIETPFETVALPLDAVGAAATVWIGAVVLAYAALAAAVAAGYLGGIDRRLRRDPASIAACVVAYAPRLFAYYLVVFAAILALVPVLVVAPPLLVLALPAAVVLGYLFYAAPFLIVVDDAGVVESFRRSYGFAVEGGPYFRFALGHVLVAAGASIALSVAVSAGPAGFVLALLAATPLGLVLTAATVSLVQDLVDGGRGATGSRTRPGPARD
ncbi:hypothetical protein [Salinilacihabitans rarus]|uniref:hypothetical protein n=1 Tax=Salinilacihabitans rarus TaxID=2961596 RepID=UPI0020C873D9|nr:hypothetical protein [Salinilacihabitans rarus]